MAMPVMINVADKKVKEKDIEDVFDYFRHIDEKFSTYKSNSEVERINRGEVGEKDYSHEMKEVLRRSQETRKETNGYFDVYFGGRLDPAGLVKGWAIHNGAKMLRDKGFEKYVESD